MDRPRGDLDNAVHSRATMAAMPTPITVEERALIDAIAAAPDDDAPRLVYADWLTGRADPRGEFIALQCKLAATPDDERRRAIRIAENKLLNTHRAAWLAPLYAALPPASGDVYKFEFARGLVETAQVSITALASLARLFELAPTITTLRVVPGEIGVLGEKVAKPRLAGALAAPEFARIRELALWLGGGGNELAREVAASPVLRGLRALRIHGSVWGDQATWYREPLEELVFDDVGATWLANTAPHLAGLEVLDLDSNRLTADGLVALSCGRWRLRELVVSRNLIELRDLRPQAKTRRPGTGATHTIGELFARPAFAGLEVLSLASIGLDAVDVTLLVGGPHLAKLRALDLERSQIGPEGAKALSKAFALPALRRLRLERNSLCDAGAVAIAECAKLAELTELELGHNLIGRTGGMALAVSPHLAKLERLTLNEPRWKPEMKTAFAESPTLANTKVYLAGRLVGRAGVTAKSAEQVVADVKRAVKANKATVKKKSTANKKAR